MKKLVCFASSLIRINNVYKQWFCWRKYGTATLLVMRARIRAGIPANLFSTIVVNRMQKRQQNIAHNFRKTILCCLWSKSTRIFSKILSAICNKSVFDLIAKSYLIPLKLFRFLPTVLFFRENLTNLTNPSEKDTILMLDICPFDLPFPITQRQNPNCRDRSERRHERDAKVKILEQHVLQYNRSK